MTRRPRPRRRRTSRRPPRLPRLVMVGLAGLALIAAAWMLRSPGATAVITGQTASPVRALRVEVRRTLPHATTAYTQGLIWRDGWLYESTGQYGQSRLARIDPDTGAVVQQVAISPAFFGEGLAAVGDELVMLTWKAGRAIVFDIGTFEERRVHRYLGEGWGLCHDGRRLVMSDGSDRLTFRDPATFQEIGAVSVTLDGRPLPQLNELECVGDEVYANVYQDEYLVVIDPDTGRVTQRIDATGLLTPAEARGVDVLNGIAYDPDADTFFITGKWWPKLFEVQFVE